MPRHQNLALIGLLTLTLASGVTAATAAEASGPAHSTAGTKPSSPPFGFIPGSASWTSPTDGWLHGFGACDEKECGYLQYTDDGGKTWTEKSAPPLDLPTLGDGVRVVFVPGSLGAGVGYATGDRVVVTDDGADTWSKVKLTGVSGQPQIGDTVATPRRVYAIVGQGDPVTGRTDLYSGKVGAHRLRPVAGVTLVGNGVNVDGGWDVVANGRHVAVSLGRRDVSTAFWTSHDAKTFTQSTPPCAPDEFTALGAVTAHRTAALCAYGENEFGQQTKILYESRDGGPFKQVNTAPEGGDTGDYVSLSPGEEVVSTVHSTGGSFVHRTVDPGWATTLNIKFIRPFLDLQFVDDQHGFVVWGGDHSDLGSLWATDDGGLTWRSIDIG